MSVQTNPPVDLQTETLLTLSQAARRLPPSRQGRPVSLSCVYRWLVTGIRTTRGRVRLEGIRLGGRWLTSAEALQRFAAALTPDLADRPEPPRPLMARQRASERAAQELDKLGI